jgi:hypothetical protein
LIKIDELLKELRFNEETGECDLVSYNEAEFPLLVALIKEENGFIFMEDWDLHFFYLSLKNRCQYLSFDINPIHLENWLKMKNAKKTKIAKLLLKLGKKIGVDVKDKNLRDYMRLYVGFCYVLRTLLWQGILE